MKKKRKKSKKKVKLKKIRIIAILVIIIIAIILIFHSQSGERQTKAMSIVDKYISYINEGKYDEMYKMLSASSKNTITEEDFIERNKTIYEQLEARNITTSNMEEEDENRKNKD